VVAALPKWVAEERRHHTTAAVLTRQIQFGTVRIMLSWVEFRETEPAMAEEGRALLYEVGVGLGFLATVRTDGGPRVHPMCPLVSDEGLFAFIVPSPKQRDLHRDGRYSLHSVPLETNEDAFYLSGRAEHVTDPARRLPLSQQFVEERRAVGVPAPDNDHQLFELTVSMAMLTRTTGHGDLNPQHRVWHAP
jgi:hypothetical protein